MIYTIYQVNQEKDRSRMMFLPFDMVAVSPAKDGVELPQVDAYCYDAVYEGVMDDDDDRQGTLEYLYRQFNVNIPKDYTGREMSVSDVVKLSFASHDEWWYCDTRGFKRCLFDDADAGKLVTKKLRVVYMAPGQYATVKYVRDELADLQWLLKTDSIATFRIPESNMLLLVDDEGKLKGKEPCRGLFEKVHGSDRLFDVICGPFIGVGEDGPEFRSLDDDEIAAYMDMFYYPEKLVKDEETGIINMIKERD